MSPVLKTIILSVVCGCGLTYVHAQNVQRSTDTGKKVKPQVTLIKPKGPKSISHEFSVGIRLNSNGWSGYMDLGRVKPRDQKHSDMFYNVRFWQLEFTEKKDPHEYKSTGQGGGSGSNTFIYGKINNFYALKLGRCYMRMLVGKPDPGSVSIHWLLGGGFSLGMLKPYYINVYADQSAIKYDDATKNDFLAHDQIEGSAGFAKGLGETKFIPGGHLKTALHFDFSANRKNVLGVEAGVNVEYYSQQVQIMVNQSPSSFFGDVYVAFQFGRRW